MSEGADEVVTIRPLTPESAREVAGGRRPDTGWADDFPGDADRGVARLAAFPEADRGTPWYGPWLVLVDDVAVGALGCKGPPREGVVEVGYGLVPSARGRGVATRALTALLALLDEHGVDVLAETTPDNLASQGVLRHAGFRELARRRDPHDGELLVWRRDGPQRQPGVAGSAID